MRNPKLAHILVLICISIRSALGELCSLFTCLTNADTAGRVLIVNPPKEPSNQSGNQGNQTGSQGNQSGNQSGNQGNQSGNQGNQSGNQGNQSGNQSGSQSLETGPYVRYISLNCEDPFAPLLAQCR